MSSEQVFLGQPVVDLINNKTKFLILYTQFFLQPKGKLHQILEWYLKWSRHSLKEDMDFFVTIVQVSCMVLSKHSRCTYNENTIWHFRENFESEKCFFTRNICDNAELAIDAIL